MSVSRGPVPSPLSPMHAGGVSGTSVPLGWPQGRDVHVWSIDLSAPPAAPSHCLDERELARARAFVYADDARRYVHAHVALRAILGAYMGCEPAALEFVEQALGKPRLLAAPQGHHFNLSHSKDTALLALGMADELGVDIEAVRDDLPGDELAAAVLCPAEIDELGALPDGQRAQPFVTCWTRKEACLKALGLGLNLEPRSLRVGFDGTRVRVRAGGRELEVEDLPAHAGYRAAVAAVGGLGQVRVFDLDVDAVPPRG